MTGVRTSKAEAKRAEILAIAGEVFGEKGFRGAGVGEICAALKMSPGNLYYYFKSKEEIITALVDQHREAAVQWVREIARHDDAFDRMFQLAPQDRVNERPKGLDQVCVWELFAEAARGEAYATKVTHRHWAETGAELRLIVEAAQRRGRVRADADIDVFMTIMSMYFMTSQLAWFADPEYRQELYLASVGAALAPFLTEPLKLATPAKRKAAKSRAATPVKRTPAKTAKRRRA
jgi:TetR/AcrR family transcriptional regulator, repressor for uid operon